MRAVLGIFCALAACVVLQVANLIFLNKLQERKRVKVGKPARIKDLSMQSTYQNNAEEQDADEDLDSEAHAEQQHGRVGDRAFLDLTDRCNEDFVYIY